MAESDDESFARARESMERARRSIEQTVASNEHAIESSLSLVEQSIDLAITSIDLLMRGRPNGLSHEEKSAVLSLEIALAQALHLATYLSHRSSDTEMGRRLVAAEKRISAKVTQVIP